MVTSMTNPQAEAMSSNASRAKEDTYPALPKGNYTLVSVDIDTTGRRLIDEIVQLAAYTPDDHFEQYIMPYMNLNPAARQRHQVRVISIGFYRMLKSMQTYKIIKSKSEIAALKDFLEWLESVKAKTPNSSGIVLLYHEERKFVPYMILESLKKYGLMSRFTDTVKSFTNGLHLIKQNANASLQHFSLRKLAKTLKINISPSNQSISGGGGSVANKSNGGELNNNVTSSAGTNNANNNNTSGASSAGNVSSRNNKYNPASEIEPDEFEGNASVRARLAYEVALHLSNENKATNNQDAPAMRDNMLKTLQTFMHPLECELNELLTQNQNLERQNSFRPIFLNYFKTTIYHRVRAVKFRIVLAEQGYDLQTLESIWSERKRDGIVEILQDVKDLKTEDKNELADLLDSFFDPNKTTIKPVVKHNNRRRNRRGLRIRNNDVNGNRSTTEHGAGGDKQGSNATNMPDSTTKMGKPQRGKRNPRMRRNNKGGKMNAGSGNTTNAISNEQNSSVPIVAAAN